MDGSLSAALTSSSDGDATSSCALSTAICCLLYTPATRLLFHSTNTNTTQLCLSFYPSLALSLALFLCLPLTGIKNPASTKCSWMRIVFCGEEKRVYSPNHATTTTNCCFQNGQGKRKFTENQGSEQNFIRSS